jgi:hypothetical protein
VEWISSGRTPLLVCGGLAAIVLTLYAVLFDNGALLVPLLGEAAKTQNYLHELFHDGRHVLGVPCH